MKRYFLHLIDGTGMIRDEEGFETADFDAARLHGLSIAGDLIADDMKRGCTSVAFILRLEDQSGRRLAALPVSASVASLPDPTA